MEFMKMLEKNEKQRTENGSVGYKTSSSKLVDLNFSIPSMRENPNFELFRQSYKEEPQLTLKWLLYLRDIREGVGERETFRTFVRFLCEIDEEVGKRFIEEVPIEEYGRWDDIIDLLFTCKSYKIWNVIIEKIRTQIHSDLKNASRGNPISLLGKWLPSEGASSEKTKKRARELAQLLRLTRKTYRHTLTRLREYLDVTEVKMSANRWEEIEYEKVPSLANLRYRYAFMKHDMGRRIEYIDKLKNGETKINSNALFLHDIVHTYKGLLLEGKEETLELLWSSQRKVKGFSNTLVVRDGSGSMIVPIGRSNVQASDVADAITLYCAENSEGEYKNKFITFSRFPQVVDISSCNTLQEKLLKLDEYNDYSTTNVESVFNLVLETAVKEEMTQEDLPKRVLIISDLEYNSIPSSGVTFEILAERFRQEGYKMPKLIFWNVNSRTNTIPIQENEEGVILLSGFSKNLMEMVMSSEISPYKALVKILNSERYNRIDNIF